MLRPVFCRDRTGKDVVLSGLLPITRFGCVYPRQPFQHRGTAAALARRSRCSASLS